MLTRSISIVKLSNAYACVFEWQITRQKTGEVPSPEQPWMLPAPGRLLGQVLARPEGRLSTDNSQTDLQPPPVGGTRSLRMTLHMPVGALSALMNRLSEPNRFPNSQSTSSSQVPSSHAASTTTSSTGMSQSPAGSDVAPGATPTPAVLAQVGAYQDESHMHRHLHARFDDLIEYSIGADKLRLAGTPRPTDTPRIILFNSCAQFLNLSRAHGSDGCSQRSHFASSLSGLPGAHCPPPPSTFLLIIHCQIVMQSEFDTLYFYSIAHVLILRLVYAAICRTNRHPVAGTGGTGNARRCIGKS
jgi:hypothetical protein